MKTCPKSITKYSVGDSIRIRGCIPISAFGGFGIGRSVAGYSGKVIEPEATWSGHPAIRVVVHIPTKEPIEYYLRPEWIYKDSI